MKGSFYAKKKSFNLRHRSYRRSRFRRESRSLVVSNRGQSETGGDPGGGFRKRGDREIDLAAVGGVVTEVVGPGLIGDCPTTFGSRIGADSSDKTGICRSRDDTEVNDVEFLQGLERDRAADSDGQSGMRTGRAQGQGND